METLSHLRKTSNVMMSNDAHLAGFYHSHAFYFSLGVSSWPFVDANR